MKRILLGALAATAAVIPAFGVAAPVAHAGTDPASEVVVYELPYGATVAPPVLTPSSLNVTGAVTPFSGQVASSILTNAAILALRPDLQTRVLDQAGPHDPTIYPPAGPQETVGLGRTEDLSLQVRNASGVTADNVEVEIWLTGFLDADAVLSTTNGFTCALNTPVAHMVFCKGGTLKAGGWDTAASIVIRAKGASTGKGVLVATVNPNHTITQTDDEHDQDARWVSVLALPPRDAHPSATPPTTP